MRVSKEFWVSDEHLDKIHNNKEFAVILRNKTSQVSTMQL